MAICSLAATIAPVSAQNVIIDNDIAAPQDHSSPWNIAGSLIVGNTGAGSLTIAGDGVVSVSGDMLVAQELSSVGTVNIGAGAGQSATSAGTLNAQTINFGKGKGTLVFNHTSSDYIFSPIISGAGKVEIYAGTTVLTGNSTYSGVTLISNGTLQLGNGGDTGSIVGNVTDNGSLVFNRNNTLRLVGTISGTGTVTQAGNGTTILTGTNSYSGGTLISRGTLQLGNGGGTGSIAGDVMDNATLAFNRNNTVIVAGTISGTGKVTQSGTGTTILTGTNSYSGGTLISRGTLQLGNGGDTGSIVGNVTDNGALVFNRNNTLNFSGTISSTGPGRVEQIGSGTTVLTADSSYPGGT
ncbi:autotransporter-associated beta strand repeat-containing protein [Brucella pituitosa]|uniref:autotransporter-associated beta strand repeat-containing protein n=1 Tax=Brucella pituitosa TaxID=571256 RepID=UPI00137474A7|nr:autotransporter-associated beta strand repeat-containing protein [Brucella pituitosa]